MLLEGIMVCLQRALRRRRRCLQIVCRSRMALLGQTSCQLLAVWTIAALSLDGVFGEKSVEGGAADAELSGGLTDIAPVFRERPLNKLLFN
jgi:hypothetical protein